MNLITKIVGLTLVMAAIGQVAYGDRCVDTKYACFAECDNKYRGTASPCNSNCNYSRTGPVSCEKEQPCKDCKYRCVVDWYGCEKKRKSNSGQ